MELDKNNKYTMMQKEHYDYGASVWSLQYLDAVVGTFLAHFNWADWRKNLFFDLDTRNKIALDFGCGPGRCIVQFNDMFDRIDGIDISEKNLSNAQLFINSTNLSLKPNLYHTNGIDLSTISDSIYDIVYSTICMQHICVYDIRFNFFKEFYRVLKPGGKICIQMGFGYYKDTTVGYYDNFYDAKQTNGASDVKITHVDVIKKDLDKIGFTNFKYIFGVPGPNDKSDQTHNEWIYFQATK